VGHVHVRAGASYAPNAWGHESFSFLPDGEGLLEDADMDELAGRLETGKLVAGRYARNRRFIFYDRDLFGNRRLKGTCVTNFVSVSNCVGNNMRLDAYGISCPQA